MSLDHLGDWSPRANPISSAKHLEKKYAAVVRVDRFVPFANREDMLEYVKTNPATEIIEYTHLKITVNVEVDVA